MDLGSGVALRQVADEWRLPVQESVHDAGFIGLFGPLHGFIERLSQREETQQTRDEGDAIVANLIEGLRRFIPDEDTIALMQLNHLANFRIESKFGQFMKHTGPTAVLEASAQGEAQVFYFNPAFARMLGFPYEELKGLHDQGLPIRNLFATSESRELLDRILSNIFKPVKLKHARIIEAMMNADSADKERYDYIKQRYEKIRNEVRRINVRMDMNKKDGTVIPVELRAIISLAGHTTYTIVDFEDMTATVERESQEAALEEKQREIDREIVRRKVAKDVYHDVNNDLVQLRGLIHQLLHQIDDLREPLRGLPTEVASEKLGAIHEKIIRYIASLEGLRETGEDSEESLAEQTVFGLQEELMLMDRIAGSLISDINDLRKSDSEKPSDAYFGIRSVFESIAIHALLSSDAAFEAKWADDLGWVVGDKKKMRRLVINLVKNAGEAMSASDIKKLTIEGQNEKLDDKAIAGMKSVILPQYAKAGEYVRLSIGDTGHGIPAYKTEEIFRPGVTTKPPPLHATEGVERGSGLDVVRLIVEQFRGFVHVESRVDEGSTFHIYLPKGRFDRGMSIG